MSPARPVASVVSRPTSKAASVYARTERMVSHGTAKSESRMATTLTTSLAYVIPPEPLPSVSCRIILPRKPIAGSVLRVDSATRFAGVS